MVHNLYYHRDYNAQPIEKYVMSKTFPLALINPGCRDTMTEDATCGIAYANGVPIRDSQGFCCSCTFNNLIGKDNSKYSSRTGIDCSIAKLSTETSASCLRWGKRWYQGYYISPARLSYNAAIRILRPDLAGKYSGEVLKLSPATPNVASKDGNIIASVEGDFRPPSSNWDLSNQVLMVPAYPYDDERVQGGVKNWGIVPKYDITDDGRECDKIGVSFSAFRNQPMKCSQRAGSCLNNQLDARHEKAELRRKGLLPASDSSSESFFIDDFGLSFLKDRDYAYLVHEIIEVQSSIVRLEIVADDIRFIQAVSPGVFDVAYIETFEAMSREGVLNVQIRNTGAVQSAYTVTIPTCSVGIHEIPAQYTTLCAGCSGSFKIRVMTMFTTDKSSTCQVVLLDSQSRETDVAVVYFNTTSTAFQQGAQGGKAGDIGRNSHNSELVVLTCDDYCPIVWDVACFFLKGCYTKLSIFFLLILMPCCCCYCCCKHGACTDICCGEGTQQLIVRNNCQNADQDLVIQMQLQAIEKQLHALETVQQLHVADMQGSEHDKMKLTVQNISREENLLPEMQPRHMAIFGCGHAEQKAKRINTAYFNVSTPVPSMAEYLHLDQSLAFSVAGSLLADCHRYIFAIEGTKCVRMHASMTMPDWDLKLPDNLLSTNLSKADVNKYVTFHCPVYPLINYDVHATDATQE